MLPFGRVQRPTAVINDNNLKVILVEVLLQHASHGSV
jgi:hypothetical protein